MKPESKDRLMGFSTSFGITFLAMMVVLGTVCFLSYFRLGRETAEEARPDAYLPEAKDRLVMLVAAAAAAMDESFQRMLAQPSGDITE